LQQNRTKNFTPTGAKANRKTSKWTYRTSYWKFKT